MEKEPLWDLFYALKKAVSWAVCVNKTHFRPIELLALVRDGRRTLCAAARAGYRITLSQTNIHSDI
jgi:hypothetical protein